MNFPRTSIVLAAGLGTRLLPTTKAVPKELLPIIDTPVIDLVAQEAALAGSQRLLVVTNPKKTALMKYFDRDEDLENSLLASGKEQLCEKIQSLPRLIKVDFVDQGKPLGLAHAVGCTENYLDADEDAIVVLLPDDLILPLGILSEMNKVRDALGGTVLCAFAAPDDKLSSYGVFDVDQCDPIAGVDLTIAKVKSMVEKPVLGTAPSNYAAAGRYILDRAIFEAIKQIRPGAGGEYQLTDAIDYLIAQGHPVHIVVHRGVRHDTGNPLGYIKAIIDFALDREDIGPEIRVWLGDRLSQTRC